MSKSKKKAKKKRKRKRDREKLTGRDGVLINSELNKH
jgi:hypothetical protein